MSVEQKCIIWGTEAEVTRDALKKGGIDIVNSVRAGGRYEITSFAKSKLGECKDEKKEGLKLVLTSWILEQNRFGNVPEITEEVIEEAETWKMLSVFERADNLLLYLHQKNTLLGDMTNFSYPEEEFLDVNKSQKHLETVSEIKCWTASIKLSEVKHLLEYCHEKKWLEMSTNKIYLCNEECDGVEFFFMLRPTGYARIDELKNQPNQASPQAFVAMWFDQSMEKPYQDGIQKAIEESGYKSINIGQKQHINKICDEIIAEIRRSKFVVVDLTARTVEVDGKEVHEARGGVYYEAGFAQGLDIPVIWTCRSDAMKFAHFDIRQYNTIVWEDSEDLYEKLKQRIGAIIGDGVLKRPIH